MLPLLLLMLELDANAIAPPPALLWVRVRPAGAGMLAVTGAFRALETTPIMLWGNGTVPWADPCIQSQTPCCLGMGGSLFRNDALQPGSCPMGPGDWIVGSRPDVDITTVRNEVTLWTATVPDTVDFLAMQFVQWSPHFWVTSGAMPVSQSLGGVVPSACHRVQVPNRPFEICMFCSNEIPDKAEYTWTSDWFVDMHCSWRCLDGYSGQRCTTDVPLIWPWATLAGGVVLLILICMMCLRVAPAAHMVVQLPETAASVEGELPPSNMVQFRDDVISHHQIRIKIS